MPTAKRAFFIATFSAWMFAATSCVVVPSGYTARSHGGSPWQMQDTWGLVRMPNLRMPQMPSFLRGLPGMGDGSYWNGDGMRGRPRIEIHLDEQLAYFYKGNQLAGVSPICSGSPSFPTPRGHFRILDKDVDHISSLYGNYVDDRGNVVQRNISSREDPRPPGTHYDGAEMHYFMRITGGVGMHAGYLPGYADSHGCIRLPKRMAQIFFANAPVGTPVTVTD